MNIRTWANVCWLLRVSTTFAFTRRPLTHSLRSVAYGYWPIKVAEIREPHVADSVYRKSLKLGPQPNVACCQSGRNGGLWVQGLNHSLSELPRRTRGVKRKVESYRPSAPNAIMSDMSILPAFGYSLALSFSLIVLLYLMYIPWSRNERGKNYEQNSIQHNKEHLHIILPSENVNNLILPAVLYKSGNWSFIPEAEYTFRIPGGRMLKGKEEEVRLGNRSVWTTKVCSLFLTLRLASQLRA
jgi:hypothetical protein